MMEQSAVKARIRYVSDTWKTTPGYPRIDSGNDRRANTEFQDVEISDARPLQEQGLLDLDTNGFVLTKHQTQVRDFDDPREIETTYVAEVVELLKGLTGAEAVIPFNYLMRNEEPVSRQNWANAYARYMHTDYNLGDGLEVMRRTLANHGYGDAAYHDGFTYRNLRDPGPYDMVMYGVWQPIRQEVQRNPLTLMDARDVPKDGMVDYVIGGAFGGLPFHDAKQRLYYFPRMQLGEVIVFKHLDARSGFPRGCPHTSFDDPNSPSDPLGRRSIEFRAVGVFGRSTG